MNELKDWRGTQIRAGDTIVYPGRRSARVWMNEGVIEEIATNVDDGGKEVTSFRVRPIRSMADPPTKKTVVLTSIERVTVINRR